MPVEKFKSAGAYKRWNAYRHTHGIAAPHLGRVCIKNEGCHTVKHSAKRRKTAARKHA